MRSTVLGVCAALLLSPAARAAPSMTSQVADLEQQARSLSVRFQPTLAQPKQLAEHRLVDAQVLYSLRDYTRAAILLLDYITKFKSSRGYPEAVFYLADSLYHKRDFLSARRYFRQIVNRIKGKYYQDALQRLVELSLRTGDTTGVETYLNQLSTIPPHLLKPSVPYVRGKYYYFRKNTAAALKAFLAIPSGHRYYLHAQYFIGVCHVRQKNYAAALKVFQALLKVQPKSRGQRHVRQLTHLAVGRLLYHRGKVQAAIDEYQKVSRRSKEFDAALYEIAWAYVKANQYQRALRALDLLVLAHPKSPFVPEVRVLQGNLLIRLRRWGGATELFTKTRDQFAPIRKRMRQLMDEHSNPNVFFDALLARNLGEGDLAIAIKVPELALHWVKEQRQVKRALHLVRDVRGINKSIVEAKKLIRRLERAINSPAKIKIFPAFATGRAHAVEVENRLAQVRHRILRRAHRLVRAVATPEERRQLAAMAKRRKAIERRIKKLPTNVRSFKRRTAARVKRLAKLERKISRHQVLLQNQRAGLVAAEKYFADTEGAKKKRVRASFRREVAKIRRELQSMQTELDDIKAGLADAKAAAGVGGPREVAERGLKARYKTMVNDEYRRLAKLRTRLSGRAAAQFDALAQLLSRCNGVDGVLASFNGRLDRGVEGKLASIRTTIQQEKARLAKYAVEAAEYKTQTDTVAGGITYAGFRAVAKRFYDIIVRSDVGIIDVAWALKDTQTKKVSKLVRQRKMDIKLLDDEFKEVLKDNR